MADNNEIITELNDLSSKLSFGFFLNIINPSISVVYDVLPNAESLIKMIKDHEELSYKDFNILLNKGVDDARESMRKRRRAFENNFKNYIADSSESTSSEEIITLQSFVVINGKDSFSFLANEYISYCEQHIIGCEFLYNSCLKHSPLNEEFLKVIESDSKKLNDCARSFVVVFQTIFHELEKKAMYEETKTLLNNLNSIIMDSYMNTNC